MYKVFAISLLLSIFSIPLLSQVNFEPGYYIDSTGKKHTTLIKNYDWKNNPNSIEYKDKDSEVSHMLPIVAIREFGIDSQSRYVKVKIKIDRSTDELEKLSPNRNPEFKEEILLLQVLVSGNASLYAYNEANFIRFFYSVDTVTIEQLIFKKFKHVDDYIGENVIFRQQLLTKVNCNKLPLTFFNGIDYERGDLERYFKKHNTCSGGSEVSFTKKKTRFHLWALPGLNYTSVSIKNDQFSSNNVTYDKQLGLRLGLMGEIVLPFQKNKWSIIIEGSFQYFNNKKNGSVINLKSIEIPIGVRHRFYLNDHLNLFLNVQFVPSFGYSFNSIAILKNTLELEADPGASVTLGGGLQYKRFNSEVRYYSDRPLFSNLVLYYTNYQRISVIFGYKIF